MDKIDEAEVLVELAAVVLDARLQVGDAHVLVAVALQGAQEGLFGEAGHFFRYAAESLETLWGGRLLEFCLVCECEGTTNGILELAWLTGKEVVQFLGSSFALGTLLVVGAERYVAL